MSKNPHGLGYKYFERKTAIMLRDSLSSWKPDELASMSRTSDATVMQEPEFAEPASQPQGEPIKLSDECGSTCRKRSTAQPKRQDEKEQARRRNESGDDFDWMFSWALDGY